MPSSHSSKGLIRPVSGGESVTTENTVPANCPPETGGTRSEATEGVDKSLNSHPLTVKEQFVVLIRLCRLFLLVARHNKSNNFASALASCVGSPFRFYYSVTAEQGIDAGLFATEVLVEGHGVFRAAT